MSVGINLILLEKGSIDFAISCYEEGIVKNHKVTFTSEDKQIELSRRGMNRNIYTNGVTKAEPLLVDQPFRIFSFYEKHLRDIR